MRMTRQQMDELINQHFGFEAADDVDGVLASLADEVRHEVVPSPMGEQTDKKGIRAFYKMLFADLKGEGVTPLRRLYGEDFVVDEALWQGRVWCDLAALQRQLNAAALATAEVCV